MALVFSVIGVNQGIFTNVPSLEAMAAGWLLLAITNILWVLYFTSEENSLSLYIFNYFGTGGLSGPGRNGFRPGGRLMAGSPGGNMESGSAAGYSSGGGVGPAYGSPRMLGGEYDSKDPGIGSMTGGSERGKVDSSQRSVGGGGESVMLNEPGNRGGRAPDPAARSPKGAASPVLSQTIVAPASNAGDPQNVSTPLMTSANPGSNSDSASTAEYYLYRARALYACEWCFSSYPISRDANAVSC